ncbi:MAG: GNAT family N-acetyltransferase [Nocardioides sp.]
MATSVWRARAGDLASAAQLLHDFNREYDDPSPPVPWLADRLAELMETSGLLVLLGRLAETPGVPEGLAVVRFSPSLWSEGAEAYLAELYVVPDRRGQGLGRALLTGMLDASRAAGADYAYLITSEEDVSAQRTYTAAGFRRTEGEDGPLMLAYERDL